MKISEKLAMNIRLGTSTRLHADALPSRSAGVTPITVEKVTRYRR